MERERPNFFLKDHDFYTIAEGGRVQYRADAVSRQETESWLVSERVANREKYGRG